MIDSTLSGIVWFEGKARVVEEVGRPPHVTEPSLPVLLLGCLGEAEAPPSVGRGTPILSWGLFQRPGICIWDYAQTVLGLFSLGMVERAPCRAIQLTNGTRKWGTASHRNGGPRIYCHRFDSQKEPQN